MGLLILFVGIALWFVALPVFVTWAAADYFGIRNGWLRMGLFCVLAWCWWQHWQLPATAAG